MGIIHPNDDRTESIAALTVEPCRNVGKKTRTTCQITERGCKAFEEYGRCSGTEYQHAIETVL